MVLEMNDKELKKIFPYGAMVIPRAENQRSFAAQVAGDPYEEDPEEFRVWDQPEHATDLRRDLVQKDDGWVATSTDGTSTYFLRPLTKEQKVKF